MITHWGLLASLLLGPQGPELTGTVQDVQGRPLKGVSIHLSPLPESRSLSSKSSYDLAQRAHWSTTVLPTTTSGPEGHWSFTLTPDQAALLSATSVAELVASAPGYLPWRRAWSRGDSTAIALERAPATPSLRLRLQGLPAYEGFLLIERSYRWRPDAETWWGDLVPVGIDGTATFDEPPRISGEAFASSPRLRPEGYRVTLLLEGLPRLRATLPPGDVVLDIGSSRLHPVEDSIAATYRHAGEEITLSLPGPTVPLLHGNPPLRLDNVRPPDRPGSQPTGNLRLSLVSQRQPLPDVGVWIEDRAVIARTPDVIPFGVSDTQGMVTLRKLPFGRFNFLFHHPDEGMREIPILHEPGEPALQVRLKFRKTPIGSSQGNPGTLLLDLGRLSPPQTPTAIHVGILGSDRRLIRRSLPEWHRLLRIDGLDQGATTVFVRVGDDPPIFLGGLLSRGLHDPAIDLSRARLERITLHVRDRRGNPEPSVALGLRQGGSGSDSTDLFHLQQGEPGHYKTELRLIGNIWARIHGRSTHLDVILPGEHPTDVLDITLR